MTVYTELANNSYISITNSELLLGLLSFDIELHLKKYLRI